MVTTDSSPTFRAALQSSGREACFNTRYVIHASCPLFFLCALQRLYCSSGKNKAAVFPVSSLPPDPAPTLAPPFENRGRLPAKRNCGMTYRTRQTAKMRRQEAEPMAHLHMLRNLFFSRADNVSRRFSEVGTR